MSALADRLRGVIKPGAPKEEDPPGTDSPQCRPGAAARDAGCAADPAPAAHDLSAVALAKADSAAEVLGGEWHEAGGQRFLVVDRRYAPGYRHGRVAMADSLPPADGMWPRLPLLAGTPCRGTMLFVDLETTGLAGGAGSYAFLVGCGWFETPSPSATPGGGVFRIRQFLLSSFAAERILLAAVAELADRSATVVTYNGKTFDLPLIETRFLLNRMKTPFAGMAHVDMLHPARRMWRADDDDDWPDCPQSQPALSGRVAPRSDRGEGGRVHRGLGGSGLVRRRTREGGSCRLGVLEEALCGRLRDGDVPGFEIPSRYFHYVRSGDPRPLDAVLEHNRLDLLSLAVLTASAAQRLEEGPAGARTAREALGMGRLYERGGMTEEARASFARAAGIDEVGATPVPADTRGGRLQADRNVHAVATTRAEALRAYALLARRERRYERAAAAWRHIVELRGCPPHIVREATAALAIHHEHRLRDPRAAHTFALQGLTFQASPTRRQAMQHRLARLERKLGELPSASAGLFTFA